MNKILKFKNKRNYIHGTDIFNHLTKNIDYKKIDIKFIKPIKSHPKTSLKVKSNKNIAVAANIIKKNKIEKIFLQNTKKKVKGRYYVNETLPEKSFKIFKKSARFEYTTMLNSIEILVSLTKLYHLKKISKKKWFFTRLIITKKFNNLKNKKIKILLDQNYKNISTVSKIYEKNKFIGKISFSIKKKII